MPLAISTSVARVMNRRLRTESSIRRASMSGLATLDLGDDVIARPARLQFEADLSMWRQSLRHARIGQVEVHGHAGPLEFGNRLVSNGYRTGADVDRIQCADTVV